MKKKPKAKAKGKSKAIARKGSVSSTGSRKTNTENYSTSYGSVGGFPVHWKQFMHHYLLYSIFYSSVGLYQLWHEIQSCLILSVEN